jgi:hypothetical protein
MTKETGFDPVLEVTIDYEKSDPGPGHCFHPRRYGWLPVGG